MPDLRTEVLSYIKFAPSERTGLSLSEADTRAARFAAVDPELWELAEERAGANASFADKLRQAVAILQELVKAGSIPAPVPAKAKAARKAAHKAAVGTPDKLTPATMKAKASESAPADADALLAQAARLIASDTGVDFGEALSLALAENPEYSEARHKSLAARVNGAGNPGVRLAEELDTPERAALVNKIAAEILGEDSITL